MHKKIDGSSSSSHSYIQGERRTEASTSNFNSHDKKNIASRMLITFLTFNVHFPMERDSENKGK